MSSGKLPGTGTTAIVGAVLRRPDLWWTGLGAVRRLAPPGWWRSPPHLPAPDRRLWRFRMVTAYGDPDADPTAADVISYLEWCRSTRTGRYSGFSLGHRQPDRRRTTWWPSDHQDEAHSG